MTEERELRDGRVELEVVGLDARGDGVAENGATVPAALPGERVRLRMADEGAELTSKSCVRAPSGRRRFALGSEPAAAVRRSTCRKRSIASGSAASSSRPWRGRGSKPKSGR